MDFLARLLPPWPLLSAFLLASLLLALTPGPGVLYVVTRSLVQGRRAGLVSVAGVALGNLGNALLAALGLAAVLALSPLAFALVRYAGAFYLIYLGLRLWRAPPPAAASVAPVELGRLFRDGLVVALLNPKTALFFAAFLPAFLAPGAAGGQGAVLGLLFVVIAAVTDSLYALAAGTVAPWLARAGRLGPRLGGSLFIGLGVLAALTGVRHGR